MILIDAIYIHSHGGLSILQAFINGLNNHDRLNKNQLCFLIDERVNLNQLNGIDAFDIEKIRANHFTRRQAYKNHLDKINKVVCLSNVPPPIILNKNVYVYFHNLLLLKRDKNYSSVPYYLISLIKLLYIRFYSSSKYKWIVQTNYMKEQLSNSINVKLESIYVLPFYEINDIDYLQKDFKNEELSFFFVTSNAKHKNVNRVIEAFLKSNFVKKNKIKLLITLDGENIINENKEIKYLGYLTRRKTIETYLNSEYVILPSLTESFGLPIIEGIKSGSNVLISNIESLKEICRPSIIFDPLDKEDIVKAFEKASEISYKKNSIITIKNEINTFIELIINDV